MTRGGFNCFLGKLVGINNARSVSLCLDGGQTNGMKGCGATNIIGGHAETVSLNG